MSDERMETIEPATPGAVATRRWVIAGAGAVGAAAVLGACDTTPPDDTPDGFEVPETNNSPGNGATDDGSGEDDDNGGEDQAEGGLVATSDVAVGAGVIIADEDVVVTQPEEGNWQAFSATCTHQGCTVSEIRENVIHCACHGSEYSIWDGSVVQEAQGVDPGTQDPLPVVNIEVDGDWVVRA